MNVTRFDIRTMKRTPKQPDLAEAIDELAHEYSCSASKMLTVVRRAVESSGGCADFSTAATVHRFELDSR